MLPTKEELELLIKQYKSNKQIGQIYNVTHQKITRLIIDYNIDYKELRQQGKYITYIHRYKGTPVYVGSGNYDRVFKSSGRGKEHKNLMQSGEIEFSIEEAFETPSQAREKEYELIKKYREEGYNLYNTEYGVNNTNHKKYIYTKDNKRAKGKSIIVYKNGNLHGTYSHIILFAEEVKPNQPEKLLSGISKIINHKWRPKKGVLAGYKIEYI